MKELSKCTLYVNSETFELKEVEDEANVYTSFLLPVSRYSYFGGEKLEYPWINGYKVYTSETE